MASPDSQASLRGDLNVCVEEAQRAEQFYIGAIVMPQLGVDTREGQYPVFKKAKGELLNNDATTRRPGGAYGRVTREYENDNYSCIDRGLEEAVDDTYVKDVKRFFAAEQKAAKFVRRQVMLGHEVRVASAIISTTNFDTTAALVDYTNANKGTIDFPGDVIAACDLLNGRGEIPNTIVLSGQVFNRVKSTTLLQNFVRGNRPTDSTADLTAKQIAAAFEEYGIQRVLVGRAVYNGAKKGQAFSSTRVWANTHIWVGRVEEGEMLTDSPGVGRTFVWNEEGGLFVTETYREEVNRSNIVRVRQNTTEKIVDAQAATMITTNYA